MNTIQTIKNLKMYLQQRNQTLFTIVSNDKYIFGVSNKRNFLLYSNKIVMFHVKNCNRPIPIQRLTTKDQDNLYLLLYNFPKTPFFLKDILIHF